MNKRIIISILISSILFTNCIGSFSAFNSIKDWNEGVTDNKFGDEIIFVALWVIPVYQIAALGDLVIFNSIEFWDGTNPIAMQDGDKEEKIVKGKKSTYAITVTKNKFEIKVTEGKHLGSVSELVYQVNDQSWSLVKDNGEKIKLTSLKKGFRMVYLPDGSSFELNEAMNKDLKKAYVQSKLYDYDYYNSAFAEQK